MKADPGSLDAGRVWRGRNDELGRDADGLPAIARGTLAAAVLGLLASGFVAAALWLAWVLAEAIQ